MVVAVQPAPTGKPAQDQPADGLLSLGAGLLREVERVDLNGLVRPDANTASMTHR
jgi:hypothetical protein